MYFLTYKVMKGGLNLFLNKVKDKISEKIEQNPAALVKKEAFSNPWKLIPLIWCCSTFSTSWCYCVNMKQRSR